MVIAFVERSTGEGGWRLVRRVLRATAQDGKTAIEAP
jgi:hypothetical protein